MSNYNFDNITIFDSNCGINITVRDSGSVQNVNFSNIRIETRTLICPAGMTALPVG